MGFGKKLEKTNLAEWKFWYMNYDYLQSLYDNEPEFVRSYVLELDKVNEFFNFALKEIINGKKKIIDLRKIDYKEVSLESSNELKYYTLSTNDYVSCLSDTETTSTEQSTSEEFDKKVQFRGSNFEKKNISVAIKKINRKIEKEEEKMKNRLTSNNLKDKYKNLLLKEEIIEPEEDSKEREPDLSDDVEIIRQVEDKISWTEKLLKQKDFLFKNNVFKRKYDKKQRENCLLDYIAAAKHVINFKKINIAGFRRIVTKYDKLRNRNIAHVLFPEVEKSSICRSNEIEKIYKIASREYIQNYHKNNPKKARDILKNINKKEKPDQFCIFLFGVILTITIFLQISKFSNLEKSNFLYYYQSVLSVLISALFFGLCLIFFRHFSINSSFIFEFTQGSRFLNDKYLLYVSSAILIHQISTFYLFGLCKNYLSLWIVIIQILPFDFVFKRSRYYLVGLFMKLMAAPFFQVRFKHFFLADLISSFVLAIKLFLLSCELQLNSWWYFLLILPAIIRICQCLRRFYDEKFNLQILNALKYFVSAFTTCWIIIEEMHDKKYPIVRYTLLFTTTIYSLTWDLIFDWNILRNEYLFPIFFYVLIIMYNLTARFLWFWKLKLEISIFYCLLIEILRRFLWLLIRVEIEHLCNCNRLNAMKYVNLRKEELFYREDYMPLEETVAESESLDKD